LTMGVGGLVEVTSWVLGFGRQAEVLEPEHLRDAVGQEVKAMAERNGMEVRGTFYLADQSDRGDWGARIGLQKDTDKARGNYPKQL